MRAIATCWLVMLLFGGLLFGGCERADAPTKQAPKPTDPVVATVDGEPLRLSWVTERLNQDTKHDVEAKARALAAAAADVICLREFAVLKLRPNPGESATVAVDRLLAGTWPADASCRVDERGLRDRYRQTISTWRHPTGLVLWEARYVCCEDGCAPAQRSACQQRAHDQAKTLAATLRAAVPPPTAVTVASLDDTPARAGHIPRFEATLAEPRWNKPWKLLRYTAFVRDRRSAAGRYRRTDPELERLANGARIGEIVGPVASVWGWSIAMVVGREPARWSDSKAPAVQRALKEQVCKQSAVNARAEYRARMVSKAVITWRREVIRDALGAGVAELLPKPPPPPVLPEPAR